MNFSETIAGLSAFQEKLCQIFAFGAEISKSISGNFLGVGSNPKQPNQYHMHVGGFLKKLLSNRKN